MSHPRSARLACSQPRWRWLGLSVLALSGCPRVEVTRVIDGQPVVGSFIPPRAYGAYARGALAEASGQDAEALHAFELALDLDEHSPELWTRVGALRCRQGKREAAADAFARAEELDASYEPLWRSRAECARAAHRLQEAADAARRAVRLDPDRIETALLWAGLADELGRTEEAGRWYRSLVARWPRSRAAWRALGTFCTRHGQLEWSERAARELAPLPAEPSSEPSGRRTSPPGTSSAWPPQVDEALRAGDMAAARRELRQAHLDERLLAARAIAVGQPKLALDQAAPYLAADPTDSDSRLAAALAADLLGQGTELSRLLALPRAPSPLGPAARLLLAELLVRHLGVEAAEPWLSAGANGPALAASDQDALRELTVLLRDRLQNIGSAAPGVPSSATPR